jgi:multidrug efflux system outer membrane protein
MPVPDQYRFFEGTAQAETLANAPFWQVFGDPALQDLIRVAIANNLDLRIALARVEEARARAGIAKSFLYPVVDGVAGYGVRQATTTEENDDTTHNNFTGGFRLAWEIDLFGRVKRQHESAVATALATEQARRGVMVTLVGDVATNYFLLRELDLQLQIARQTLTINDQTVAYLRIACRAACRTARTGPHSGESGRDGRRDSHLERQIAVVENGLALLLGRPPGSIGPSVLVATEPLPRRSRLASPRRCSNGGPTLSKPSRCWWRPTQTSRGQGALLSVDWPVGFPRRRQRRSHDVPRRNGRDLVVRYEPAPADLSRWPPAPECGAAKARFDGALAAYQKAALNSYARSPIRW